MKRGANFAACLQVVAGSSNPLLNLDTIPDESVVLVSPNPAAAHETPAPPANAESASSPVSVGDRDADKPARERTSADSDTKVSVADAAVAHPSETKSNELAEKVARIRQMLAARQSERDFGRGPPTSEQNALASDRLAKHQEHLSKTENPTLVKIRQQREKLPAYGARKNLLEMINGCPGRVCVVSGSTGCGKTTQVPQFILEDAIARGAGGECSIVCTQPRRISAIGVAERVAAERDEKCGSTVGYAIRLESRMSAETRLSFLTTGLLLRRLISDPTLQGENSHCLSTPCDPTLAVAQSLGSKVTNNIRRCDTHYNR